VGAPAARADAVGDAWTALAVVCLLALPPAVAADRLALAGGRYDISAQMLMPHLEEMRRIRTREARCIAPGDAAALFPVLRQPALRGCAFAHGERGPAGFEYLLVCESARVASGRAQFEQRSDRIIGVMDVKMGGKNMTFTQRIEARRDGDCDDGDAVSQAATSAARAAR
jgi:hypothetical protein